MTKDKIKKIVFLVISVVIISSIILCCFIFFKPKKDNYTFLSIDKIEMPTLNIKGDLSKATASKNKITVGFEYSDDNQTFDGFAELKVQGASSSAYPKKNYNIKLFKDEGLLNKNKVTLVDSWGKQNKCCLKANYIDFSQSRNVVSAGIYGQIVKSRGNIDELYSLTNGGAIDGYPVAVYNNNKFHGIYTLNIPKDKWMFGMDDENIKQAMVMCEDWVNFSDGIDEDWKTVTNLNIVLQKKPQEQIG